MSEAPRVVDLFCGGGGFSEGFRRAGFEIVYANDIDADACATHELNHPETETVNADIVDIAAGDLPQDFDVLIGSPPCTEFSYAKKGGGGDIDEGMRLVGEYLRFVAELEPDYWVMENVPRLDDFLDQRIEHERIPSLDSDNGVIEIPKKAVLDSSDYRTPQRRERLFSGRFPLPPPSQHMPLSFGELQAHYPHPLDDPREGHTFEDSLNDIELEEPELSDHFYNSFLTEREAEEIRVRKEDHSFYGTMSFPEDSTVPARTVLATNRRIARETLVLEEDEAPDGFSRYRKPTIREIASVQGFPITYQFTGNSLSKKWRRVGDAVPPPVAYAIANAIREEMGLETATVERTSRAPLEYDLNDEDFETKGRRKLSLSRSFRHHVPMDDIRKQRVDLETDKDRQPTHPISDWVEGGLEHPVAFQVHLYLGYGKDVSDTSVDLERSLELLENVSNPERRARVAEFLQSLDEELGASIPDTTTVQAARSRRLDSEAVSPTAEFDLLERVTEIVDEHFPSIMFGDWVVRCDDLLDGVEIPGRVLMQLATANYMTWKMNHGAVWLRAHPDDWYLPDDAELVVGRSEIPGLLDSDGLPDESLTAELEKVADGLITKDSSIELADD